MQGFCSYCKRTVNLIYRNGNTKGDLVAPDHDLLPQDGGGVSIPTPCPGSRGLGIEQETQYASAK